MSKTYWIVCPKVTSRAPKIATFRNWLLAEAAEDAHRLKTLSISDALAHRLGRNDGDGDASLSGRNNGVTSRISCRPDRLWGRRYPVRATVSRPATPMR